MLTGLSFFGMRGSRIAAATLAVQRDRARIRIVNGFGSRSVCHPMRNDSIRDVLRTYKHNCFIINVLNTKRRPAGRTLGSVTTLNDSFRG